MNAKLLTSTSMITGKVALSYPNLLTPSATAVSKGKFGCNFFNHLINYFIFNNCFNP